MNPLTPSQTVTMLYVSDHLLTYPGPWQNHIVSIGLGYTYASGPYQWTTTPRTCVTFFLSPLEILPVMITTWYYTFLLGSIIQDIKFQFPHYIKFQHVTSSIRISPSCLNISVLISWINLKDQWTCSGPEICWLYWCRRIIGFFMSGFEQPATWFGHSNLCWNIL